MQFAEQKASESVDKLAGRKAEEMVDIVVAEKEKGGKAGLVGTVVGQEVSEVSERHIEASKEHSEVYFQWGMASTAVAEVGYNHTDADDVGEEGVVQTYVPNR